MPVFYGQIRARFFVSAKFFIANFVPELENQFMMRFREQRISNAPNIHQKSTSTSLRRLRCRLISGVPKSAVFSKAFNTS